jgi:hypothetical protein
MSVPPAFRDSSSLLLRTIPALQCGRAWIVPEGRLIRFSRG